MVAAVCGSFRGFCSSKCTGGLRFWNKRNNRSSTFLFGFDLSIQRRRKRLDSLTDLLMKMMTAAMKWHWYLQKCPLYEHTLMTSCIAEAKKSLTSSMIHLQLWRPWWQHVQTLTNRSWWPNDQQYLWAAEIDEQIDKQRMMSRDRLSNIGIWLLARRILHLRIGILKPFLVGSKKTRQGPGWRVGALCISRCWFYLTVVADPKQIQKDYKIIWCCVLLCYGSCYDFMI